MGKYEEALERARQGKPINEVFPELKESEDERIRKALVKEFKEKVQKSFVWKGIPNNAILNWLEKQKEEKGQNEGQKIVEYPAKCALEVTVSDDERAKEDERIRKQIEQAIIEHDWSATYKVSKDDCLAYLEKQKEPMPIPDKFSGLKSLMQQYLQSAANRKDDAEIESDTDLWGRKILDYVWKYEDEKERVADGSKTSAEWSKEDNRMLGSVIWHLRNSVNNGDVGHTAGQLENWLKALRPSCKPSEEQMIAFQNSVEHVPHAYYEDMRKLYEQLKKLM